ncbi:MAG: hypothetical protein IPL84_17335 [Chitinophagaceae bacterium]|nr:hypothetical protein [Chitinophagaceae bacterium]
MKKIISLIVILTFGMQVFAQEVEVDTLVAEKVTITKDPRLDILGKFQSDLAKTASRFGKGYRLFVLKTNDREYAMKVRTYLLQNFPDEKVIMTYQSPFIKMKFGDFVDKPEAEKVKKQIIRDGVVTGGIYIVPDTIELKPDKNGQNESK